MDCTLTRHASVRMQQRSIPGVALSLLIEFGTSARTRGADSIYFDRVARQRVTAVLGRQALCHLERYLDAYIIVADDGAIVTAGWRNKRLRRP